MLAGLRTHRGPILIVANWPATLPGLVGLLGLTAGLTKVGVRLLDPVERGLHRRLGASTGSSSGSTTGQDRPRLDHVRPLPDARRRAPEVAARARPWPDQLRADKAIIGVFDEGCMGMYNAIFDDELLNPLGIYKERLSQSALYAEMRPVPDAEADAVRDWLDDAGHDASSSAPTRPPS